ncbi:MAG: M23 family metallopeptidase [Spirochaetales bacterium]|nr:M23 family metallopeptidase [Spirochaetales bacterium]MCF7939081.1 M23 family metallopeptidase [Spirochaetales bacterium]
MKRTKYRTVFLFLLLSLLLFPAVEASAAELNVAPSVKPGEVLLIRLEGIELQEVSANLRNSENEEVAKAEGFLLQEQSGNSQTPAGTPTEQEAVVMLAVSNWLTAGSYQLSVEGREAGNPFRLQRNITVNEGAFVREEIPLNSSMTELRKEPDPRKARETRELIRILRSFDPEIRYHTGVFRHPLPSHRVTSKFGTRRVYQYNDGSTSQSIHNGLDLSANIGTPIPSPAPGLVVFAGERILTGYTVILAHLPGVYTLFYHLDSIEVEEGQEVSTGDEVGRAGATGLVTGSHLHWEVRVNGVAVDPLFYVSTPLIGEE